MHFLEWDKSTLPYVPRCAALGERGGGVVFPQPFNTQDAKPWPDEIHFDQFQWETAARRSVTAI